MAPRKALGATPADVAELVTERHRASVGLAELSRNIEQLQSQLNTQTFRFEQTKKAIEDYDVKIAAAVTAWASKA
jgi:hypothetical protein